MFIDDELIPVLFKKRYILQNIMYKQIEWVCVNAQKAKIDL